LDSESNVYSAVGNNFTDQTASIELTGFPETFSTNVNGTYPVTGTMNGRNSYYLSLPAEFGGSGTVSWNGTQWQLFIEVFPEDGPPNTTNYLATGNTTYPWQATWADGTVTRTATTFDVLANSDDTVALWGNKVNGYPSMEQTSPNNQPTYFNADSIRFVVNNFFTANAAFPQTWGNAWSYYVVSTPMTDAFQSGTVPKYILGHSGGSFSRGGFGVTTSALAVRTGNTVYFTTPAVPSGRVERPFPTLTVFSARVNTSGFTLGSNLTFQTRSIAISSSNSSSLTLGSLSSASDAIATGYMKEVLVYRGRHDDTQANTIVNYLVKRWGITL
jgi:hypothetical protein